MSDPGDDNPASMNNGKKKQEHHKHQLNRDVMLGGELWTDGLICAFEFVWASRRAIGLKSASKFQSARQNLDVEAQKKSGLECRSTIQLPRDINKNDLRESSFLVDSGTAEIDTLNGQNYDNDYHSGQFHARERSTGNYWIPIGWARISELLQTVQVDAGWALQPIEFLDEDEDEDVTVADIAAPYWERPVGPTWWCHVAADHPFINAWLSNAQWLHPAISIALRDESKLISERMKHLLYEVPVRVTGGLLFELLGQSVGDSFNNEDDIPIVLRSWQAQNFLLTSLLKVLRQMSMC